MQKHMKTGALFNQYLSKNGTRGMPICKNPWKPEDFCWNPMNVLWKLMETKWFILKKKDTYFYFFLIWIIPVFIEHSPDFNTNVVVFIGFRMQVVWFSCVFAHRDAARPIFTRIFVARCSGFHVFWHIGMPHVPFLLGYSLSDVPVFKSFCTSTYRASFFS